jgi:SAM-dependent methyltransferase
MNLMNKNYLKFFKIVLKKNTLLRALQIYECLNINLRGISLEFGATSNKNKTFSNFVMGSSKFHYTNKISNHKFKIFYSDLTKKLKISSNKYNNVLFFNILEHLPEYKLAFSEIYRIIKKGGYFIGSVPIIYQIHADPNDYFRFSRELLELNLNKYKFKKIKIKSLGFGPFIASYSLLYPYLRYLPFLSQICLLLAYIFDSFIQIFVKTDLEEIFPLGYFFIAKK